MCVCVAGEQSNSEREREQETESVCLDQLHSKSVYSAQFGIKHNRLLSACYCLWCPIKMEFIAALRASPNYTFFPLRSVLPPFLPLICTFSFSPVMVMAVVWDFFCFPLLAAAVTQVFRTAHYRPNWAGMVAMPATCQPSLPSPLSPAWRSDITLKRTGIVHECDGISCTQYTLHLTDAKPFLVFHCPSLPPQWPVIWLKCVSFEQVRRHSCYLQAVLCYF